MKRRLQVRGEAGDKTASATQQQYEKAGEPVRVVPRRPQQRRELGLMIFSDYEAASARRAGLMSSTALNGPVRLALLNGAACLAALAAFANPAAAQGAQEAGAVESIEAAPISVTATRTPMKAFDVPGQVTVKRAQEIADEIPASLGDLLDDVPGVTATGGPRRTGEIPAIRGFSGADVIVTLDGARQNFVAGHDGRAFIDPAFLGEVEIVRGASSALHGSGGTGGVIALRSLRARDILPEGRSAGLSAGLSWRSGNDEFAQRLIAAYRPDAMTDISAGLVRRRSDDIRLGNGTKIEADDDILSGFARARLETGAGAGVKLGWNRFSNDAREPNNGQAATGTLADKEIDSETFSGGFFFNPAANPFLDADVTVYRVGTRVDETNLSGSSANQLQEREITTFGFAAENSSRFTLGSAVDVTLTAGVDYYREEAFGALNGGVRGGVVSGDQSLVGYFVQSAFSIADVFGPDTEITITPGLRYDRFRSADAAGNATSDNQLSPKITATLAPVSWGFVYASYGAAFRAPRLDELFPTGTHFPVFNGAGSLVGFNSFIPNTGLKPQSTDTAEFGAGVEFADLAADDDVLQAKLGYYRIDGENFLATEVIQNADTSNPQFFPGPLVSPPFTCRAFVSIAVDPNGCGGTTQIVNVPEVDLNGLELEATYDSPRLRVRLAGSTMDTEDKRTGDPISTEQPDMLVADLRLKLPEHDSFIGWKATFADAHDGGSNAANDRDAYQLHEAYARWRAQEGPLAGFSLGVTAENLFDETYQRVSSVTIEEGRSVLLDVSYTLTW